MEKLKKQIHHLRLKFIKSANKKEFIFEIITPSTMLILAVIAAFFFAFLVAIILFSSGKETPIIEQAPNFLIDLDNIVKRLFHNF